jgi:hypothetical protein
MALSGLAMLGAGLLLLLRLRTLGRLFQWFAAVGGWGLAVGIVLNQLPHPYKEKAMLAILGGCILASLSLSLLPLWLRKLEED